MELLGGGRRGVELHSTVEGVDLFGRELGALQRV